LAGHYLFNNQCVNPCPSGYRPTTNNLSCEAIPVVVPPVTPTVNTTTNTTTANTTVTPVATQVQVYFPHVIVAVLLFALSLTAKAINHKSLLFTNYIVLLSILEVVYVTVQFALAVADYI
jgi:hypothetical protein